MIKINIIFNFVFQLIIACFLFKDSYAKTKTDDSSRIYPIKSNKINEQNNNEFITENNNSPTATIQILNKVTAKSEEIKIKIGQEIKLDKLSIKAKKCWKSSPDQKPENKILLEIKELQNSKEANSIQKTIFYGWMFSSSPSISGLEHPIYDITAINCQ